MKGLFDFFFSLLLSLPSHICLLMCASLEMAFISVGIVRKPYEITSSAKVTSYRPNYSVSKIGGPGFQWLLQYVLSYVQQVWQFP